LDPKVIIISPQYPTQRRAKIRVDIKKPITEAPVVQTRVHCPLVPAVVVLAQKVEFKPPHVSIMQQNPEPLAEVHSELVVQFAVEVKSMTSINCLIGSSSSMALFYEREGGFITVKSIVNSEAKMVS